MLDTLATADAFVALLTFWQSVIKIMLENLSVSTFRIVVKIDTIDRAIVREKFAKPSLAARRIEDGHGFDLFQDLFDYGF